MTLKPQLPRQLIGDTPDILTAILDDDVNLAVWRRSLDETSMDFARYLADHPTDAGLSLRLVVPEDGEADFPISRLPGGTTVSGRAEFHEEAVWLVNAFACLVGARKVGLRLQVLTSAMCPRFHVDHVPLRLVTTWLGPGSEWLEEGGMDRKLLGTDAANPDQKMNIHRLTAGDVALLKGERWIGNEGRGLVHRSPDLPGKQRRLVMTLDWLA